MRVVFNKGIEIDHEQVSLEWLPLDALSSYEFYPSKIVPFLINSIHNVRTQVYIGDMG